MSEQAVTRSADWFARRTCIYCREQTMRDSRVCGRCTHQPRVLPDATPASSDSEKEQDK